MNNIKQTIKDIKSLKIQSAQGIAKAAITSLATYLKKNPDIKEHELYDIMVALINARPTEPTLRNSLKYFILMGGRDTPVSAAKKVSEYFVNSNKKITSFVDKIISPEETYFTHCHSRTVVNTLISVAKKKSFIIANTETRPLFQGRTTALELSKYVPVIHSVDSAGRILLKDSKAVFFGCDAILNDGVVINKIGSEMFAEIAKIRKIPVYILTSAFKFSGKTAKGYDEIIEDRSPLEVWKPKKNIHIINHAFERISSKNVTAIISELGVLKPSSFVRTVKQKYNWIIE